MTTDRLPAGHGRTFTLATSGSTGEPVRIRSTALAARAWAGQLLRDLTRHAIDPSKTIVFLTPRSRAFASDPAGIEGWFPELAELGLRGRRFDLPDTKPIDELVEDVLRLEPEYLWLHPSVLQLLCASDRGGRLALSGIRAVLTVGMRFPAERRREMAAFLNCRVIDQYACQECGRLATTCPICDRYHVDAETTLLEALDDEGEPVASGETGWVALTPFYNYAMPLIRYAPADRIRLGSERACDLRLPTIEDVYGKEQAEFLFDGHIRLRPALSARDVLDLLGARSFQIAQVGARKCEFRIVPGNRIPSPEQLAEMTKVIRDTWWDGIEIDYRIVDAIRTNQPGSKMMLYVNEHNVPS